MGTIIKRHTKKGPRYKAQVYQRGKLSSKTFPTRGGAKAWIAREESQERNTPPTGAATLKELIAQYETHCLHKTKSGHNQRMQQLNWWASQIGDKPLSEITPALIIKCRDSLNKTLSNSTCNRYHAVLSAAFREAVGWGLVHDNAVRRVRRLPCDRGTKRYLSKAEVKTLMEKAKEDESPHIEGFIMVALTTGMRRSEIQRLLWRDVDIEALTIKVVDTKNGKDRVVPITSQCAALLTALRQDERVFPIGLRKAWERVRRKAKLHDVRFHDLRHTVASHMVMAGVQLRVVAELLGHGDVRVTMQYAHLDVASVREGQAKVGLV